MQRFLITPENQMVTISSTAEAPEGGTAFDSEQQLAEVTSDWPASRLVEIWNGLPGVTAIRKFKDRATAISRIWKQAQSLPPFVEPTPVEKVPAQQEAKSEAGGQQKALVVAMLDAAEGVTLAQIMAGDRLAETQRARLPERRGGQEDGPRRRLLQTERQRARLPHRAVTNSPS